MRYALSVAMMAALSGCASVEDPFLTGSVGGGVSSLAPALTQEVPAAYALGALPAALGAPRSVRQTAPGGEATVRQEIVYANTTKLVGENILTIEGGRAEDGRLNRAPTRNQLAAEIRAALPGVPMKISQVIGENAYGVFGYATGAYGAGACIYGWQVANTAGRGGGLTGLGAVGRTAQVRLRYCDARISQAQIPMLMRELTLRPLNSAVITTLRTVRGAAPVAGASLAGMPSSSLFDVPAASGAASAYIGIEAESRPTVRRPVAEPVRAHAQKPAGVETAAQPVIVNAARIPLPGEAPAAAVPPKPAPAAAETASATRQKAADAWSLARGKISGIESAP